MTGAEHYTEAAHILAAAGSLAQRIEDRIGRGEKFLKDEVETGYLRINAMTALAQVHATLAQAAAAGAATASIAASWRRAGAW